MILLVFDENISAKFAAALRRRYPDIDAIHAADLGWNGLSDPEVLNRCEALQRVLVTADKSTMPAYALEHVSAGGKLLRDACASVRAAVRNSS